MNKSDFAEIFTSLFNGNAGEAEQAAETISYDSVFNLSEEYDRRKQDRITSSLRSHEILVENIKLKQEIAKRNLEE